MDLTDKAANEADNKMMSELDSTERICDLIMQSQEEIEIIVLNKKILSLKNENISLKDRCDRLISKLNTVEEIIREYQVIARQNSVFKNLRLHVVNNFSLFGNLRTDKKIMSTRNIKGDNISEELSNLTSRINENNEISQSFLKHKILNQFENTNKNQLEKDVLKNVHNDFSNESKNQKRNSEKIAFNNYYNAISLEKPLSGIHANSFDFLKMNNNKIKTNQLVDTGKQNNNRKIITEELQSVNNESEEIQNAIEFAILPDVINNINLTNLKKFDDEVILKMKERFIELQYFNFIENKKRIESLLQIQDNILNIIVEIKEKYNKNLQQDENQMKILLEDDYLSKCSYKDYSEKNYTMNILVVIFFSFRNLKR